MGRAQLALLLVVAVFATSVEAQTGRRPARQTQTKAKAKAKTKTDVRAIVIDHTRIKEAARTSPATLEKIGETSFYFAHASVGGNMLKGLKALNKEDPKRFPLKATEAGKHRDGPFEGGVVYEDNRGNPGWRGKVDHFQKNVDDRWHGKGLVALDKFCYVDPDADADVYLETMAALMKRHPDTVIVLATIPLRAGEDRNNVRRQTFNEQVRQFTRERNGVLFDIADIESHDPNGRPLNFGDAETPTLYDDYTNDGGHLNAQGARQVALGFYALIAALAERDEN